MNQQIETGLGYVPRFELNPNLVVNPRIEMFQKYVVPYLPEQFEMKQGKRMLPSVEIVGGGTRSAYESLAIIRALGPSHVYSIELNKERVHKAKERWHGLMRRMPGEISGIATFVRSAAPRGIKKDQDLTVALNINPTLITDETFEALVAATKVGGLIVITNWHDSDRSKFLKVLSDRSSVLRNIEIVVNGEGLLDKNGQLIKDENQNMVDRYIWVFRKIK